MSPQICPICKETCDETVMWRLKDQLVKSCARCKEENNTSKLSSDYYEKAKKRVEEERRQKNRDVLRSYRIKP